MNKPKVLVIDDDVYVQSFISNVLQGKGFSVTVSSRGSHALSLMQQHHYDLIMLDLKLPDMDGIDVLQKIKTIDADSAVIIITAYGTMEKAVEAMRFGAYDFLNKPFDSMDKVSFSVCNALERKKLKLENTALKKQLQRQNGLTTFIAQSKQMQNILSSISKLAVVDSNVLIEGETGTGKEIIARLIHEQSHRKDKPFLPLNCGAIPENLQESILFGYEKGAFTGAYSQTTGYFEDVCGGTLFLDEIGEASPDLQVKLLRVLQDKKFSRIGSTCLINTDFRLIAATNRDLKALIESNQFREDLYYRIAVIRIYIPPLRERKQDILPLINHFLKLKTGKTKKISKEALSLLENYTWKGNVRELQNCIENICAFHNSPIIDTQDLPSWITSPQNFTQNFELTYRDAKQKFEKEYLENLVQLHGSDLKKLPPLPILSYPHCTAS
ncbi:MAG: sigma-54-dependent Fis family transcriptional regulator [Firmicutes bacterium]|nr:sigma-54-dependent Fis family transcriptional regulator [Bacillota bacterium]NLY39189.1 sigma-54-dependent Fis family transcriptional regulator [Bacillota bacterium]